ncbi:MAG: ATP-binding protein, partial [Nitrososphaerales archaeon]
MSDPSLQPQILNLGTAISKGEIDSSFFMEENEESTEPFQVDANLISTGRTCVIGSSGSGKSYTVGVICEELCKAKVPFAIIDLEGEYSGLKEKYEVIWVGDDEGCDLMWSKKVDLKQLARYAPDCPPIILDVSEVHRPREKVNEFLIALYSEISKRRTPYLVILEEADRFSPQSGGERLPIIDEIARRGRKRGLGLMICTQRPSLVDKNILSQCSNQLIGKLVIKNDLNSVAQFFSGRDAPNVLTSLKPGEFFALGGLSPEPAKVKMRVRETRHGGM